MNVLLECWSWINATTQLFLNGEASWIEVASFLLTAFKCVASGKTCSHKQSPSITWQTATALWSLSTKSKNSWFQYMYSWKPSRPNQRPRMVQPMLWSTTDLLKGVVKIVRLLTRLRFCSATETNLVYTHRSNAWATSDQDWGPFSMESHRTWLT